MSLAHQLPPLALAVLLWSAAAIGLHHCPPAEAPAFARAR